jgi:PAS domain S-box-containing protein
VVPIAAGWHASPPSLVLGLAALLSMVLVVVVWRRRPTPGATPFCWLLLAAAAWAAMAALEHAAIAPAAKVFWAKLEYPGIVSVSPLWLTFVLAYTEQTAHLSPRGRVALWIVPLLTVALAWTNEWHHLVWTSIEPSSARPGAPLVYGHGAWFWLAASYNYVLNLLGAVALVSALVRWPGRYRSQWAALLVGLALPWLGNALYLAGANPLRIDLTPLAFTLTGLVYAWGVFRLQLFDLVPVARDLVMESMSDGVLVLDAHNRVVDMNRSARRFVGVGGEPVIGERAGTLLAAWPDLVERYRDVAEALALVRVDTPQGPRDLDLRISPLRDAAGRVQGRLIVARDVTAARQAEQALRQNEKLAALGRLAAGVAHELTNPLAILNGRLQLLRAQLGRGTSMPSQAVATHVAALIEATERMKHIVHGLASYSKPARAEPTLLDVRTLLADVVELVAHQARANRVQTVVDVPRDVPAVLGERTEMTQILLNLATNAIEAMTPGGGTPTPGGGTLTLGARLRDGAERRLVSIEVSDTGPGIAAHELPRIWEPFYTTKPDGTGLGLSIVRALVDKQPDASITVHSEVGVGTTFRLVMPARGGGVAPTVVP